MINKKNRGSANHMFQSPHVKEAKCSSEIGNSVFELVLICVIVLMAESVSLNHLPTSPVGSTKN
jgi:hypothetical protein